MTRVLLFSLTNVPHGPTHHGYFMYSIDPRSSNDLHKIVTTSPEIIKRLIIDIRIQPDNKIN